MRLRLRAIRLHANLTQQQLADMTHVSLAAIRSYESVDPRRQRTPSRQQLEAIMRAVYAPRDEETWIMEGFGYSRSTTLWPLDRFPNYFFELDDLVERVERIPWPEFVVNSAVDIVAANQAAERLWGVTLTEGRLRSLSGSANLLAVATRPEIASRIANWEECVSVVIGTLKGTPDRPENIEAPSRRFEEVLADVAAGTPRLAHRIGELWAAAEPIPAKVRWDYPVVWVDPTEGEIRFRAIVSTASEPAGLAFNDWHPIDAESWLRFERVVSRRAAEVAEP